MPTISIQRVSSLDASYATGQLSLYPTALDTSVQLYQVANNAETVLTQTLTYNGSYLVVQDNSLFPDTGILRVGPSHGETGPAELIYYEQKTTGVFSNLVRGFASSRQNPWPMGSYVSNPVSAEPHNTLKDAILNIEANLGESVNPAATSLNGILTSLENIFLAPHAKFRAYPIVGTPPLQVKFQNFSNTNVIRTLWDFGDGTTSIETSPIHTYPTEGSYTINLNIITNTGAQGITTKSNYITVSQDYQPKFFYVQPQSGDSIQTSGMSATIFLFVDQTDGKISQRYWIFDDGTTAAINDPNEHTISHQYALPGSYSPSLLILFADQSQARVFLQETIIIG